MLRSVLMKNSLSDPILARLLAGKDEPSVIEREALWARLEESIAPGRAPLAQWIKKFLLYAAPAAAAAALLFVFLPRDEFRARGTDRPSVAAQCLNENIVSECRGGSLLTLALTPTKARPYVAAFVETQNSGKTQVIWLIRESIALTPKTQWQSQGYALGENLSLDIATLNVIFSKEALSHEALKRAVEANSEDITLIQRRIGGLP